MSAQETTPSKEYIDETNQQVQLDHSRQFIEDPRFGIAEQGVATINYNIIADGYDPAVIPLLIKGFAIEDERFSLQLRRALEFDKDTGLFEQPYQDKYARLNNELVELNAFLYTCYGLDLIGLINDRNRYQEQINTNFHEPHI